jgi:DNA polymerase III delta prime subunit
MDERVASIVKWIDAFLERGSSSGKCKDKSVLLVYGRSGSGKTFQMARIGKMYDTIHLDSSYLKNKKDMMENIQEATNFVFPGMRKIVIVDDVDVITGSDKAMDLKKFIKNKENKTPLILVCDEQTKKAKEYASICEIHHFEEPTDTELACITRSICSDSDNKLTSETVDYIVSQCDRDIRNIVQMLSQINSASSTSGTINSIKGLASIFTKKDQDPTLYQIVNTVPNQKLSFEKSNVFFQLERSLVPMLIHENYADWISECTPPIKKAKKVITKIGATIELPPHFGPVDFSFASQISACASIVKYISDYDIIERNTFMHYSESSDISLAGMGVSGPNHEIAKYKSEIKGGGREVKHSDARFTRLISNLATKKARETSLHTLYSVFGKMEDDVILLLRNKIYKLIKDKTASGIKFAALLLLDYNLDVSVVDSLLRMFVFKGLGYEKMFVYTAKMKSMLVKEYERLKEEREKEKRKGINIFCISAATTATTTTATTPK